MSAATARPLPVVNAQGRPAKAPAPQQAQGPTANADPYPRIPVGQYVMYCSEVDCYRDFQFKRGVCQLAFSNNEVHDGVTVYCFLNLGDGARGRRSRYWRAWVRANNDQPRRGQTMSPRVFKGKWFKVSIVDVVEDSEKQKSSEREIYSKVAEILELCHV